MTPEYFLQLFVYNAWANRRAFQAASGLNRQQYIQEQGHSWGSVHGLLVHILGAEWIWLERCLGRSPQAMPRAEDFPSLESVVERWEEVSRAMSAFLDRQTLDSLQREVAYTNTSGRPFHLPLWKLLAHLANHGTHHRGELAAMYAVLGAPHQEDDLYIYFLIQSGQIDEQ